MSALSIQVPFPVFQDRDGQPLDNGYVWLGTSSLNPQTNPVVAYYDSALTIVATQPLRTLNGFISRAGSPAQVYVDAVNFSILVQDRQGTTVFSVPEGTGISPNASGVVYDPAGTGAVATTVQAKLRESVSVLDYYANGVSGARVDPTGVLDSTLGIQAALTNAPNYSTIDFVGGTYKTTAALVVPVGTIGLVIQGGGAVINCIHNGDGLVVNSTNESTSRHRVYDLNIKGPNVSYPANAGELVGTSTGAGLRIGPDDTTNTCTAYMCSFVNCRFDNFLYGVYMQNSIMCQFTGGGAFFNQYGVYIDGGQTNANNFTGFAIRENRDQGIKSSGRTGGSLSNATHNTFYGCEIETNIPYNLATGGYPATFDSSGAGTAIVLSNSYGFVFDGCYFENHNYSCWFEASSDQNQFINCRFAPGGTANVRVSGVTLKGSGTNNNVFQSCRMVSSDVTTANVVIENSGAINNQFLDCQGFNFISASLTGKPYIRNNIAYIGGGTPFGLINAPSYGGFDSSAGLATRGNISGTTGSVTLNVQGCSEIRIGTSAGLTGNISITQFTDVVPLSFFSLYVSQGTYTVTVVSGAIGTGPVTVCRDGASVVMSGVGNYMLFWVDAKYQVIEVSRNFDALLTVATLPAPAALYKVVRYTVSDSTVAAAGNFGAVVAGGGVNVVPVFYDGGNWRIG